MDSLSLCQSNCQHVGGVCSEKPDGVLPRLQVSDLIFSRTLNSLSSRIVTETTFTSECENIVQHICEEHYHVPVPVHVHHPVVHQPPHVPFGPPPNPNGRRRRRRKRSSFFVEGTRKKRASRLERQELILGLKQALGVPPPPLFFHQELPAPPGCRSLVTQKCHKVGRVCPSSNYFNILASVL